MTEEKPVVKRRDLDQIVIRSWPKVIFLYPLLLTSLICGIIQSVTGEGPEARFPETAGMIFFVVMCLNFLVIAFEFSRFKTLAIFFFFVAIFFFLLYLSTRWGVFTFLGNLLSAFHLRLSTSFYFATAAYFLLIFVGVFMNTRFNYWVIRSNEILHKEGFLGDVRRYPSPNLKMTKEILDVFEFLLLGSGRIVLSPATEKQAIVLDHVLRVNQVEKDIQELLSALQVEIEAPEQHEPEGIGAGD
jgi:hypothetical protein